MKVGTYTRLRIQLLGCALLWTSAACGSRTSLLMEEDAGVTTETSAQESNTSNSSGGRAGSSTTGRAGRGATAGAGGMGGSTATGGRSGRAGRGGSAAQQPRGGAGGRTAPRDRDAAADSGEDEEQPRAGSGGEESGGSGGEQADAGGEQAGAGGEGAGEPAAGSGGSDAEPVDAGAQEPQEPVGDRLTALTPEQTSELCGRIESATANLQWNEAVTGWCSRGSLGTPECSASQESCVEGAMILPICSQSVPDCPDITIEEFVTCRTDVLLSFVEYNRTITCDTPPGLPGEAEVASCVGPYQRCAPLAALAR